MEGNSPQFKQNRSPAKTYAFYCFFSSYYSLKLYTALNIACAVAEANPSSFKKSSSARQRPHQSCPHLESHKEIKKKTPNPTDCIHLTHRTTRHHTTLNLSPILNLIYERRFTISFTIPRGYRERRIYMFVMLLLGAAY